MTRTLPFLTEGLPGILGTLRAVPEDFRVDEIPAYTPSGEGEHLYIRFEKRGMTTPMAVDALARALHSDPREAGWAGMKDRHAVTTQWASFARADLSQVDSIALDGIRVLESGRHKNKLRTGHLHGNRFVLRVTSVSDPATAVGRCEAIAEVLRTRGAPNYYGDQRFGREGDNSDRGMAWLRGEKPPPRDPFLRKMWVSAVQSELFNRYLADRVARGDLDRYVDGDLAVRHPVGRPWAVDPTEAPGLYATRGASATGPMFGTRMSWPTGEARTREEAILTAAEITVESFGRGRELGEGTRRAVRAILDDLTVRADGDAVVLEFTLAAGGYATTIVREFQKCTDDGLKPRETDGIPVPRPDRLDA